MRNCKKARASEICLHSSLFTGYILKLELLCNAKLQFRTDIQAYNNVQTNRVFLQKNVFRRCSCMSSFFRKMSSHMYINGRVILR